MLKTSAFTINGVTITFSGPRPCADAKALAQASEARPESGGYYK